MQSTGPTSDDAAAEELESEEANIYVSNQSRSDDERYICIKKDADLVLDVEVESGDGHMLYLVSTVKLRDSSPYFRNLLDPEKFSEGVRLTAVQRMLRERYRSWGDVPPNELPRIPIKDIGQLSSRVAHEESMTTFLSVLHGVFPPVNSASPSSLANLVVVADRFDGLSSIKELVRKHHILYWAITTKWLQSTYKEEPIRQILLSGVLLNLSHWITSFTTRMVNHGSRYWGSVAEGVDEGSSPLWWTLPNGVEGGSMSISHDFLGLM